MLKQYIRYITPKRAASGRADVSGLAPGNSVSDLTSPGMAYTMCA